MARKRQEIKVVLHKPEKMDSDRRIQMGDFLAEIILNQINKCDLTEEEQNNLRIYVEDLYAVKGERK